MPRYFTIVFPGEFGQHVQETWSEEQILSAYLQHWTSRMLDKYSGPHIDLTRENCLEDWKTIHWAEETDQFGKKL